MLRSYTFFFKPSTRAFWEQAKARPDFSLAGWLHGYVYGRWPYLYIAVGTGRHPLTRLFKPLYRLFKGPPDSSDQSSRISGKIAFANGYHGKVMPLEQARKLVSINRNIDLGDLEQVIPYASARDIVLQNPDHIVALECPCRASRHSPCLPLDVCLIVGEPFAGFIAEHHPKRARRISRQEALDILSAEQKRGHVHHAFFKDVMLGRFYAICNCCACCCGAMQAQRNGVPMLAASGYVCAIDQEKCKQCGLCVKQCQFSALKLDGERLTLNTARCMGCGVCVATCPTQALKLMRDPGKGIPLDIHQLSADNS
jgi:ferredoxin